MIKNIANDSIIRSAVSSTANDRKQVAQMESDKRKVNYLMQNTIMV
jgi:hypothetical protein